MHTGKETRSQILRYWTDARMQNAKPAELLAGQSPKAQPGSGSGPGAFYTNFMFLPAYRDGSAPYGRFAAPTLLTTSGWRNSGEFGIDAGAAVVGTKESGQSLTDAVAELPLAFNSVRNQSYSLYGYAAAKRFNGQRLRVCNTAWSMNDASANPATMGVPCDMTGGSSGCGWVTSSGAVASVVSYGYASLKNVLFGPHLETEAQQLYQSRRRSSQRIRPGLYSARNLFSHRTACRKVGERPPFFESRGGRFRTDG